jgi:hypothetical protein
VTRSEADPHGHYGEHEPPQENPKLGNLRGRLSDVEQADSKEQPKDRKDNVGSIAEESENKGHKEKPNEMAQPLADGLARRACGIEIHIRHDQTSRAHC